MNISIMAAGSLPIYEQIVAQIKNEIIAHHLKEGDMLPSIRSLARDLQISVITTKRAYEELEKEQLIYSVAGKGFYVAKQNPELLREKKITGLETVMSELIREGRRAGLTLEDLKDTLEVLWEEETC